MTSSPALHDPAVWSQLIDAVQPASILVAIAWRMGDLRQRLTPEDIWQETLLRAWQSRHDFQWQGASSFRRWLVVIAERCIASQWDHEQAQKRSAGRTVSLHAGDDSSIGSTGGAHNFEPWGSTTPSRIATERERAFAMQQALASLADEVREVVRLRLFEDLPMAEVASRLGLGESAVRHRFRRGTETFHARLRALLGDAAENEAGKERDVPAGDSG